MQAKQLETFETLRARIRARHDVLSPHLQRVARSALEDPSGFALRTVATLAREIGVQPSTLIRFAKEFGYGGFSAMQQVFKLRLIEGSSPYRAQVYDSHARASAAVDPTRILNECVGDMVASLNNLKRSIRSKPLSDAIAMLQSADHVYVAGLRRSRPIAAYLAYGLMRVERPCSLLDFDGGMAAQQVANMRANDVLVAIAFAEYSAPVVDAVKDAHLRGLRVLALTDLPTSPLARSATLSFLFNDAPKSAFRPISGPLALVQTLVVALASR